MILELMLYSASLLTVLLIYIYFKLIIKKINKIERSNSIQSQTSTDLSISKLPTFELLNRPYSNNGCQLWTYSRYINYNNINEVYHKPSLFWMFIQKYFNKEYLYNLFFLTSEPTVDLKLPINDTFRSFDTLSVELRKMDLEQCNVIIGVDFTASNEWKGRRTFNSQNLHQTLGNRKFNPYQKVISILGFVIKNLHANIYAYGFGDQLTKNETIFSFHNKNEIFKTCDEVLDRYNKIVKDINLSGPTSFAPIINNCIDMIRNSSKPYKYHILFIIADGSVSGIDEIETSKAIENASNYPLSIIMIGLGDGPWDKMVKYDDLLINRQFDNFQFVDYHKTIKNSKQPDLDFALNVLMEIPQQYKLIKNFGYLN